MALKRQKQKQKQTNVIKKQKELFHQTNRLKDFETKLMVTRAETLGGRMNWEVRMGIDALLHTKLIDNKDVVCSLEKSVQYSVIAYIGKESEKEWLCVCVCVCVWYTYANIYTIYTICIYICIYHIYTIYIYIHICICMVDLLCCTPETNKTL